MNKDIKVSVDALVDVPKEWEDFCLTESTLAKRWQISVKALQKARRTKMGITVPYHKLSSCVRYKLSDVIAYEQASRVTPTNGGVS